MTYRELIKGIKAETYKLDTQIFLMNRVYDHLVDRITLFRTTKPYVENILIWNN